MQGTVYEQSLPLRQHQYHLLQPQPPLQQSHHHQPQQHHQQQPRQLAAGHDAGPYYRPPATPASIAAQSPKMSTTTSTARLHPQPVVIPHPKAFFRTSVTSDNVSPLSDTFPDLPNDNNNTGPNQRADSARDEEWRPTGRETVEQPSQDPTQHLPDPICRRIRVCPAAKGLDGVPGPASNAVAAAGIMPNWTRERIDILSSMSPLIRARTADLRRDPDRWWTPAVDIEHDGVDEATAARVLETIGPATAQRREWVSALCRECNVLWSFCVVARLFPASQTWEAIDDADGTVAGSRTVVRRPLRRPESMSGASLASSSLAAASATSPPRWCWQVDPGHKSRLTALQLANIAFVLEWDDVFKRELKTVVWDWTGARQASMLTPVERLKTHGEQGLDTQRGMEKARVLARLRDYLDRQRSTNRGGVKRVLRDLDAAGIKLDPSSFLHPSVYSMMREIEGAVLKEKRVTPPASSPTSPAISSSPFYSQQQQGGMGMAQPMFLSPSVSVGAGGSVRTVNANRPATPGLLGKIKEVESAVESIMSGGRGHRRFVVALLTDAHEFISHRQDELAREMWKWRECEIDRWMATG